LARKLAELHQGSLTVGDSDTENEFVLTIPEWTEPSIRDNEEELKDLLDKVVHEHQGHATILAVEDNTDLLRFLLQQLEQRGYTAFGAANGKEALSVMETNNVDVVVSDVMMPEMDGFELCQHIKTDIRYSHVPVILLTARSQMADQIKGLQLDADAYVVKPFSMDYVVANIDALVSNRKKLREAFSGVVLEPESSDKLTKLDKDFLIRLNAIIQENYSDPEFSTNVILDIMKMSHSVFYRKIKGLLDMTPNDYIRLARLKKAASLIKEGHGNVSDVGYLVGFSSPSYFIKCFREQYSMTPKDFYDRQTGK
jgi:DNA-binding response OmpR family regulator